MKLYQMDLSPFAARCRIQIYAKGLNIEFADPPGGLGSDEYKRINPTGKVPALEVEGSVLPESHVICEYLEDRFPDPALRPAGDLDCARMRLLSHFADLYLMPPLTELFGQTDPKTRDATVVSSQLDQLRPRLDELEGFLAPGPYAAGENLSLADCTLMPMFFFATRLLPLLRDKGPLADRPKLAAWWEAVQKHEAVQKVDAEMAKALAEYLTSGG